MIGQKGPGREYPGETCYHRDEHGRKDCKELRCWTRGDTRRSTLCAKHEAERNRNNNRKVRADRRAKRSDIPEVEPVLGDVWGREKGKGAGICITPGCQRVQYNNGSRCKHCLNEQKRTDRPVNNGERWIASDEADIPRRVSSKPPVLPYSFRAFSWKGTLSEELRNSR